MTAPSPVLQGSVSQATTSQQPPILVTPTAAPHGQHQHLQATAEERRLFRELQQAARPPSPD